MAYENEPRERRVVDYSFFKRISWGAIFAGFIIAVVINLTLNLLGLGIGIGAVDPMQQEVASQSLGIGAIIWYVLSIIISLVAGGWVAAHLSGIPERLSGLLHGVLTWCLFTIFTFYLFTTAIGGVIGITGRVVGQVASLAGQGVSAIAPEVGNALNQTGTTQQFKTEVRQIAQRTIIDPAGIDEEIDKIFGKGDSIISQTDRRELANAIAKGTNMDQAQAQQIANRWIEQYQESKKKMNQLTADAEKKARVVADDVKSALSTAAIAAFIGLIVGATSAGIGGIMGRPHEEDDVTYTRP